MYGNKILPQYTTVAVISAAAVFLLYLIAQNLLPPPGDNYLIKMLTGIGVYFIVFKFFIWIYVRFIWIVIYHSSYIGGEWEYVYDVYKTIGDDINKTNGELDKTDRLERRNCPGRATIMHTIEGIHFSAESGDKIPLSNASSIKTLWDTTSCFFAEGRISAGMEYSNERASGLGFFVLHSIPATSWKRFFLKPVELRGYYVFLEGAKVLKGRVVFYRIGTKPLALNRLDGNSD